MRLLAILVLATVGCGSRQHAVERKQPKTTCDPGDKAIASSTFCRQDDATCYQLADGSWCTGDAGEHGHW